MSSNRTLVKDNNKDAEYELAEKQEELLAQKEELTAAIEELVLKNNYLNDALIQLQKRNNELDLLLYKTSHDLKSPVTSIQGLLHLMSTENLTDSQHQLIEYIDQKTSQMSDVLKSLNMLSQASFEKLETKKTNLQETVQLSIKDLKYLPNFQSAKFHFDYNGLEFVFIDENALYNILKCLISNAITFCDPVREINVRVNFDKKDNALLVEVTDDGDGIPPEIGSKIFDMFFRGSERSHGSGLGLYIVKVVVERLKGEIRWISRPGKTTFQIVLPGQIQQS
jgi:signal transduction histidine kinase